MLKIYLLNVHSLELSSQESRKEIGELKKTNKVYYVKHHNQ